MDIGFPLNCNYITEINITPRTGEPTWAWVGPGIRSMEPSKSETSEDKAYYDGGGSSETNITGLGRSSSITGDRLVGDDAQDYIASLDDCVGNELKTQARITSPDGRVIERDVTIHNIIGFNEPNGEANANAECTCDFSYNGSPRIIKEASGKQLPEEITLADGDITATIGTPLTLDAAVKPAEASQRLLYAVEDTSIARVSSDGVVTGLKTGETQLSIKCAAKPAVGVVRKLVVAAAGTRAAKE